MFCIANSSCLVSSCIAYLQKKSLVSRCIITIKVKAVCYKKISRCIYFSSINSGKPPELQISSSLCTSWGGSFASFPCSLPALGRHRQAGFWEAAALRRSRDKRLSCSWVRCARMFQPYKNKNKENIPIVRQMCYTNINQMAKLRIFVMILLINKVHDKYWVFFQYIPFWLHASIALSLTDL